MRWMRASVIIVAMVMGMTLGIVFFVTRTQEDPSRVQAPTTSTSSGPSPTYPKGTYLEPTDQDQQRLLATWFAVDYWSFSPNDSPTSYKKRVSRWVVDPSKFTWRNPFRIENMIWKATLVNEPVIERFGDTSSYYTTTTVRVDIIDPAKGIVVASEYRQLDFYIGKQPDGTWKVEAEAVPDDIPVSPTPTTTRR